LRAFEALPARAIKKEPALADSSIFDVSDVRAWELPPAEPPVADAPALDAPVADAQVVEAEPAAIATSADSPPVEEPVIEESPIEASPVEAPSVEAAAVEAAPSVDEPTATEPLEPEPLEPEPLEEKPDLAAFGDLSAFDKLSPKSKSPEALAKLKVPLPSLLPPTPPQPPGASNAAAAAVDLDDEAEWELSGELGSATQNDEVSQNDEVAQNDEVTEAIARPAEPDRPWRDVDDVENDDGDDDEDSDELTGVLAKDETTDPAAPQAVAAKRAFKDVDDLDDDDEDDPSEHLPTRVLGVPAPTITQRTLVPPPPSRGSARGAGSVPLPSIPAPPTLPRNVPPSIPPVAFDWILPRAKRAGSLTLIVGGLALLLVGVLPLVVLGGLVTGAFSPARGSLVVTVAGAKHGPVQSPVVVTDDVPRCKESPCRVTNLEPGTHFVRVTAPGYQQMAPRAVTVEKGGEVVLHVELAREPSRITVADNAPAKTQAPLDLDDPSVKLEALPKSAGASNSTAGQSVQTSSALASRAATPAAAAVSNEPGKLNLSSTPPSNVVLDGRPLGVTPRSGIKVKPGAHSVVFIHPKHGRKTARANVKPGGTSNVSVRFR
jgi:hypothetical protein